MSSQKINCGGCAANWPAYFGAEVPFDFNIATTHLEKHYEDTGTEQAEIQPGYSQRPFICDSCGHPINKMEKVFAVELFSPTRPSHPLWWTRFIHAIPTQIKETDDADRNDSEEQLDSDPEQ